MSDRSKPEEGFAYGQYRAPVVSTGSEEFIYDEVSQSAHQLHPTYSHATRGPIPQQVPFSYPSSVSGPEMQNAQYVSSHGRSLFEVISYTPTRGSPGDELVLQLRSLQDLSATPLISYHVMFKNQRAEAQVVSSYYLEQTFEHKLATRVPPTENVDSPEPHFLWLLVADEYGNQICQSPIGEFVCDVPQVGIHRRLSQKSKDPLQPVEGYRRTSMQHTYAETHPQNPRNRRNRQPQFQLHPSPTSSNAIGDPTNRQFSPQSHPSNMFMGQAEGVNLSGSGRRIKREENDEPSSARRISTSSSPAYGEGIQMGTHHQPVGSKQAYSVSVANPPLIRTSTLQPSPGPRIGSPGPQQNFNPYSIYPNNKAILKIEGDLDQMLEDWTEDELGAKRRLVEFERSQSGNTITTSFKPVTLEQRAPNSICVSCIWWEGRGESFVTSVDTIYLLESLVAVRFTVEEKNRIRRNLEGFRPLTVAKGKHDSDEFFKVIMGFPNPKPRNIEKDVKVFPWKILKQALKKIIGKYSASYSSTAGTLPPPMTSHVGSQNPSAPESPSSTTSSTMSYAPTSASSVNQRPTIQLPSGRPDQSYRGMESSGMTPQQAPSYFGSFNPNYGYTWPQTQYGPPIASQPYSVHSSFDGDSPETSQIGSAPATYAPNRPNHGPPSYGPYHQYGQHTSQP